MNLVLGEVFADPLRFSEKFSRIDKDWQTPTRMMPQRPSLQLSKVPVRALLPVSVRG